MQVSTYMTLEFVTLTFDQMVQHKKKFCLIFGVLTPLSTTF
jgi:hypothetical protein